MNNSPDVETRMKAAMVKDKNRRDRIVCKNYTGIFLSISTLILLLFQSQNATDQNLQVVRFHILRNLPDRNPIIVKRER